MDKLIETFSSIDENDELTTKQKAYLQALECKRLAIEFSISILGIKFTNINYDQEFDNFINKQYK
jgi:hypothetical protein